MNRITTILIAATFTMAGCASPYVEPTSGPTAKLTIPVFTDKWDSSYDGGGVQIAVKNNDGCGTLSKKISSASHDKDLTVNIVGDSDIFFSID